MMVTHLTQVVLSLDGTAPRAARAAAMGRALAAAGFELRRSDRQLLAASTTVEAGAAKALLREAGFNDREFQIVLEYARAWGTL